MIDWFQWLATEYRLDAETDRALHEDGFAVIEGPVPGAKLDGLTAAYDQAVNKAVGPDKRMGSTTTRLNDLVNRGPAFDDLYIHPPVLAACCRTIRQPFKLSNMLARTLNPRAEAQDAHVDFARDQDGWPMLGFILMIDEFTALNGATRFLPGSHHRPVGSPMVSPSESNLVPACGTRGAVIVYNGSAIHGHGTNLTDSPRRSIQGAFIRRSADGFDLAGRMSSETRERIGPLAKYLISV